MDFRASFTEIVTAVGGVQEEFFFSSFPFLQFSGHFAVFRIIFTTSE